MRILNSLLLLSVIFAGCKPKPEAPPSASESSPSITDRDWVLVSLGENTSPAGNGGKPVTLRLESADRRAVGNAGCNRFSGPYTLSSGSSGLLSFGPAISTKMACEQGMEVEQAFLAMLPQVDSYEAADSTLELRDMGGALLARFRTS